MISLSKPPVDAGAARELFDGGYISWNEFREMVGLEPLESGGDVTVDPLRVALSEARQVEFLPRLRVVHFTLIALAVAGWAFQVPLLFNLPSIALVSILLYDVHQCRVLLTWLYEHTHIERRGSDGP